MDKRRRRSRKYEIEEKKGWRFSKGKRSA